MSPCHQACTSPRYRTLRPVLRHSYGLSMPAELMGSAGRAGADKCILASFGNRADGGSRFRVRPMHIHTHMHTSIYIHTHMHIYIHSHMHIFIHSHLHILIHSHMHIDIHSLMHFYIHSHMHIDIHSHTYIYIHIHIHTYTYIYIHSHTYTYDGVVHMFLYKYICSCICSYLHVSDCLF